MADKTPEVKLQEYKKAFQQLQDGEALLTLPKFREVMTRLGFRAPDDELWDFMTDLFNNGDDQVTFPEFVQQVEKKRQEPSEEMLRESFRLFDRDGDGKISAAELRDVFGSLGEKFTDDEIDSIIREADANCDGEINYEEFVTLMKMI